MGKRGEGNLEQRDPSQPQRGGLAKGRVWTLESDTPGQNCPQASARFSQPLARIYKGITLPCWMVVRVT